MYSIFDVDPRDADLLEVIGKKSKFWFEHESMGKCIFKYSRPNTGEHWAEKIIDELCVFLKIPHAKYEIAKCKNQLGSLTPIFVPPNGRLVHGNELLSRRVPGYPENNFYQVRQHTLKIVLAIMKSKDVYAPLGGGKGDEINTALGYFIGYLMLDTLVANQDRHHQNWGLILTDDIRVHLSPTFDHAAGLGMNEVDAKRQDRLTTRDHGRSMETYVGRARSALYLTDSSHKPMHTIQTFIEAAKSDPMSGEIWLSRVHDLDMNAVREIFERVPRELISETAIIFSMKIIELNKERLLKLRGTLS